MQSGTSTPPLPADSAIYIGQEQMSEFERRLNEPPKKLTELAGKTSCCIFRVPKSLMEINEKAFQPHIVSIGPYHHGNPKFAMIQEHKWRLVSQLLRRIEPSGVRHRDLFDAIAPLEVLIRDSYSENLELSGPELIEMMVLDGCFIIELFCKVSKIVRTDHTEPLFTIAWILPFLMRDILMLENQIPYPVLKALFDLCVGNPNPDNSASAPSLSRLALGFFNYMTQGQKHFLERYYDCEAPHLLALFRETFLPPALEPAKRRSKFLQLINSAKKLHLAGVKFRPRLQAETFLDIRFKNGLLEIPRLVIDDFSSVYFPNFVAYEQCYGHSTNYLTTYATFMGCLINTPGDAGFLCDHKIVDNYFGTEEEIARFFNGVGKDVAIDIQQCYLSSVFEEVNEYYWNNWHVRWAGFKHTYFDTPWSFISALAAIVLLLLTMIQSFFAVYSYIHPPNQGSGSGT